MGRIEDAIRKAQISREQRDTRTSLQVARRYSPTGKVDQPRNSPTIEIRAGHIVDVDDDRLLEERVIAASEHDERVGPYRQLRTHLLKTMRDNQWTTLAITSPNEGAGKTLTATNLAISLAKDVNTTVFLVDLDLNTPSVHRKLNLSPEKGLVDYLEGRAELEEILFDPGIDRLTVLVGRSAGRQSSELLATPKMQDLMRDMCHQDETSVTIFDLPPLLRNDDAMLFAPYADGTLLVVEDGVTTEDDLRQAWQHLDKANAIGTILNKAIFA